MLKKSEVIDIVGQFSRYYGNQLVFLENIKESNSIAALIYLTNILENVLKSYKDDYGCTFHQAITFAYSQKILTDREYEFLNLNNERVGIRELRNKFAHANLSMLNFKLGEDEILYPFTENDNCELFYDLISEVLFNIICKVALEQLTIKKEIFLDEVISNLDYSIIIWTPEQILEDKGIDTKELIGWDNLSESDKYRHAENAQNVQVLSFIFSQIDKLSEKH